mmetsp:Transcript_29931/g.69022  ORF Transcript_29931/g.69022 Transcript_29931/m.69022 type:complete len:205 (+) Transcript_29931:288-902(+)
MLGHRLLQTAGFLRLVLHILILGCLCDLVLLGHLVILALCSLFCEGRLSQTLGEVALGNFQDLNDGTSLACLCRVELRHLWLLQQRFFLALAIVFTQDTNGLLHASNACFEVNLVLPIGSLLVCTSQIHLCLKLGQRSKLLLELCYFTSQLRSCCSSLVNLRCQGVDVAREFFLLGVCLFGLLIAVGLVGCLRRCFLLQPLNHL